MNDPMCRYLELMGIQIWKRRQSRGETVDWTAGHPTTTGSIADLVPDDKSSASTTAAARKNIASLSTTATREGPFRAGSTSNDLVDTSGQRLASIEPIANGIESSHGNDQPLARDRAACIAQMDWAELHNEVSGCTACGLHATRTQTVFGVGNRQAQWMIIGEAPGADEDRLGEPFVGRAGKLLDAMLLALGLKREQVFIANILKCRPPKNRDPLPEEAQRCWPFLERQIALVKPKIILALGRIAAQNLLQTGVPIGKLRGRVYRLEGANIPVVVSYHPAYLLRSSREKRKAWDDLQLAHLTLLAALETSCQKSTSP